jgi:hypothetical protein
MNTSYRKALLVLIAFSLTVTLLVTVADASCAAPDISLSATKGERGKMLTISGQYFAAGCNDVGPNFGIFGGILGLGHSPRAKKIKILLKQGEKSLLLTTVDADSKYRFSVKVAIPVNATLGLATLIADTGTETSEPIPFEIIEGAR